ncbi:MAG TPA: ABC transporter permease [Solirubrobacteraceae bacterium]|nr:ABC transporter permease [Solirubrobacteraceae bacterium]
MKRRPRRPRLASLFTSMVMVCLYAPIAIVLVFSVNKDPLLISWKGFTTQWYSQALHDPQVRHDMLTSLEVAALSTVISLVIAVCAGMWARSASPRARRIFDAFTYSRIVLPEVVFALGLLVLFSKLHIAFGIGAIVLGHVVFNSAYATVIIQARLAALSTTLEEAAADLGANRWRVFRRVTLPLLLPAVLVAALLTISFSFDDVIVSQFLGGNSAEPISVLLLGMIHLHVTPEVNAIGSALMLITLVSFGTAGLITVLRPTGAGQLLALGRRAAE